MPYLPTRLSFSRPGLLATAGLIVSLALGACGHSPSVTQPILDSARGGATSFAVPPPPKAPVPSLPLNGATDLSVSPKMTWKPSAGAKSYGLQIASDAAFTTVVTDASGLTVTSVVVAGLAGGTQYFWRVNATSPGGTSAFSAAFAFTTKKNVPPGPPPPSTNPCVSLSGLGGEAKPTLAVVPQFRPTRLRLDLTADVAAGTLNTMGKCATAKAPGVQFISGTGNVFLAGTTTSVTASGKELSFGPLLLPPAERGVVLGQDVAGDALEIIWPALAGEPASPPILRLQLASYSQSVKAGAHLDVSMTFTARAPDGTTATFTANGSDLVIPPLKLAIAPARH